MASDVEHLKKLPDSISELTEGVEHISFTTEDRHGASGGELHHQEVADNTTIEYEGLNKEANGKNHSNDQETNSKMLDSDQLVDTHDPDFNHIGHHNGVQPIGCRQPGSDPPRQQTQHEVEVYSYRHAEDSSAEGVDTYGNEGDTSDEGAYTDVHGQSTFHVNVAGYEDSTRGADERRDEERVQIHEAAEHISTSSHTSFQVYDTTFGDITLHDASDAVAQSPLPTRGSTQSMNDSSAPNSEQFLMKAAKDSPYDKLEKLLAEYVSNSMTLDTSELQQFLQYISPDERYQLLKKQYEFGTTALHVAAWRDDTMVVGCMLELVEPRKRYELLKIQDCCSHTALHDTARTDRTDVMRRMLEMVEPENRIQLLNIPNSLNKTSLDVAGGEETAQFIRQYRESTERETSDSPQQMVDCGAQNPDLFLIKATKDSPYEKLEEMLAEYVSSCTTLDTSELEQCLQDISPEERFQLLKLQYGHGATAIHAAIWRDDIMVMMRILELVRPQKRYELLRMRDSSGDTPFHDAAIGGRTEAMKCLLEIVKPENRVQLLDIPNLLNKTALDVAEGEETAQFIRQYRESTERKISEREPVRTHIMRELVPGSTQRTSDWTASHPELLFMKATKDSPYQKLEKMLAEYVSNSTSLDTSELEQCLQDISPNERYELLKKQDEFGTTALHRIAWRGHTNVMRCLLKLVEPKKWRELLTIQDHWGDTSLRKAARRGISKAMIHARKPKAHSEEDHDDEGLYHSSISSLEDVLKEVPDSDIYDDIYRTLATKATSCEGVNKEANEPHQYDNQAIISKMLGPAYQNEVVEEEYEPVEWGASKPLKKDRLVKRARRSLAQREPDKREKNTENLQAETQEDQNSTRGDNEESDEEESVYVSFPGHDHTSMQVFEAAKPDIVHHDTESDDYMIQNSLVRKVSNRAQDENEDFVYPAPRKMTYSNQIPPEGKMNQNETKNVPDSRIRALTDQWNSSPKFQGPLHKQLFADKEDPVEHSRFSTQHQSVCYETSVKDGFCRVQLTANYLVVVPFDSGTVGEFCGMMSEDYDGSCSILDTEYGRFNKRIQLSRLKAPFLIQFGEIQNLISSVE